MNIGELILSLHRSTGPDRSLDEKIAILMGYVRQVGSWNGKERVVWLEPDGNREARIPAYTRSTEHAYDLAERVFPGHRGGCSWEPDMGSARVNEGPFVEAANPAIALCIAVLLAKRDLERLRP